MTAVALSLVALIAGLAVVPWIVRRPLALAGLDGFVLASLGGLVLVHVLPQSVAEIGAWAAPLAGLGFGALVALERRSEGAGDRWLPLIALGLGAHAILDGAALAAGSHGADHAARGEAGHGGEAMVLAVLLHRVPVGLFLGLVWGHRRAHAWGAVAVLAVGTVVGFLAGERALPSIGQAGLAAFQAFFAGNVAHVLIGHVPAGTTSAAGRRASALGACLGVAVVAALAVEHPVARHCVEELAAHASLLDLAARAAPAFLAACAIAGLAAAGRTTLDLGARARELTAVAVTAAFLDWPSAVALAAPSFAPGADRAGAPAPPVCAPRGPVGRGLAAALARVPDATAPWLLAGLGAAAFAEATVHEAVFAVVPATAQLAAALALGLALPAPPLALAPLLAVLVHKGLVGAAAALALIAAAARARTRAAGAPAVRPALAGVAALAGLAAAGLLGRPDRAPHPQSGADLAVWASVTAAGLVALGSLFRRGPRAWASDLAPALAHRHDGA
jgi:hypothetical protein